MGTRCSGPEPARLGPRARAAADHTIGVGSRVLGGGVHVGRRPRHYRVGTRLRRRVIKITVAFEIAVRPPHPARSVAGTLWTSALRAATYSPS